MNRNETVDLLSLETFEQQCQSSIRLGKTRSSQLVARSYKAPVPSTRPGVAHLQADKPVLVAIVFSPMDLLSGIDVKCPGCGRRSRYPVVHAGKTVACPSCKHEHAIPEQDGTGINPVLPPADGAPSAPPAPPAAPKKETIPVKTGEAEKILFVCGSCQYRARIPAQYAGMAVRCPSCDAAQIANTDDSAGTTGNTVQLSKIPTAGHKTVIRPGNILFICSQCNFEAQLAKHYVGKAIRCPGCHAPQVVAGETPSTDPAALERNPGAPPAAPAADPRFICVGCGYRARIPTQYMGLAVTCPKCDTVQIATPEDHESASTGDTVAISKLIPQKTVHKLPIHKLRLRQSQQFLDHHQNLHQRQRQAIRCASPVRPVHLKHAFLLVMPVKIFTVQL